MTTALILSACGSESDCQSESIISPIVRRDSDVSPIILFGPGRPGLAIAGVKDGELLRIENFTINDKSFDELDWQEEVVTSDLIMPGDVFKVFDLENNSDTVIVESVLYCILNRSYQHFVWATFEDFESLPSPFFGISADWNPLPRMPEFGDNIIKVDIDGNGVIDTISWQTMELQRGSGLYDGDMYYELAITVNFNGNNLSKSIEYWHMHAPLEYVIGVFDITGNGSMDLIVYKRGVFYSNVLIYAIDDSGFTELLDFFIHGG
jgi:hypothetical protein